eukprot:m.344037 g.344037  ORF g.344037 m.344037 type:complete len:560 (-) comp23739_c0_seq1:61-1740(-)
MSNLSVQLKDGEPITGIYENGNKNVEQQQPLLPVSDGSGGKIDPKKNKMKNRLVCLDAMRGLTVVIMILVDNTGYWFPHINHSPWGHVTLADFVMPYFLFMVGCSMSLAFKRVRKGLLKKVVWRTIKLFILGLLTQGSGFPGLGNDGIDLKTVRIPGILQRIAWAYLIVSLIAIYVPRLTPFDDKRLEYFKMFKIHSLQWIAALVFMLIYLIIMLGVKVPSYDVKLSTDNDSMKVYHVNCDISGDLSPRCSAARYIDNVVMGYNHMYGGGEFSRLPECSTCSPSECKKPLFCNSTHGDCSGSKFSSTCKGSQCAEPWCYDRLDPEGTLSSFPTVVSTFIGFHYGMVLHHFQSPGDRLMQWIPLSIVLICLGIIIQLVGWLPNKQLWSPAYVCIMAGTAGLNLSLFFTLLDFSSWQPRFLSRRYKFGFTSVKLVDVFLRPLVWVGMNTIFIYLMSPAGGLWEDFQDYFYWETPDNNLKDLAYRHLFCGRPYFKLSDGTLIHDKHDCKTMENCFWFDSKCETGMFAHRSQSSAMMVWVLSVIAFWVGVAGVLHARKWYWAL